MTTDRTFAGSPGACLASPSPVPLRTVSNDSPRPAPLPTIAPQTLCWTGGHGGTPIDVTFVATNPGDRPTRTVIATLGAAPFGAFFPSTPVRDVRIPSLAPGASVRLNVIVRLRALRRLREVERALDEAQAGSLRAIQRDVALLLDDTRQQLRSSHWIGNFDIVLDGEPHVERHCAHLDRVPPGQSSIALAGVHVQHGEDVTFERSFSEPGWSCELTLNAHGTVADGVAYRLRHTSVLRAALQTPAGAATGSACVVRVTRASDGRTVPVEFRVLA